MVHRLNIFLLSILLVVSQVFLINRAFADAAEKWELVENVYDAAKNTVNVTARKITQEAANSSVYKVSVPVSSGALGATTKAMLWAGVAAAGTEALIQGVGWIIDEGSKVIKKPKDQEPSSSNSKYYYQVIESGTGVPKIFYDNQTAADFACHSAAGYRGWSVISVKPFPWGFDQQGLQSATCTVKRTSTSSQEDIDASYLRLLNPNYDPDVQPQYVPVSDPALGDLIRGKSTEPNAPTEPQPDLITDAYNPNNPAGQDLPAPKAVNDALKKANPQPDKEPEGQTKKDKDPDTGEATGDEKFTLPNFCTWAPSVCDFFKVQKQANDDIIENQNKQLEQDKTFFDSVKDWFDWSKEEPNYPDNQEVEIDETVPFVPNTSYFNWGAYCPFSPGSQTISLENTSAGIDYDLTSWCELASDLRPFVLAAGALMSFLIASGVILGRND